MLCYFCCPAACGKHCIWAQSAISCQISLRELPPCLETTNINKDGYVEQCHSSELLTAKKQSFKRFQTPKTFPHFQDEQHKLLAHGLWCFFSSSARVSPGPHRAAARAGSPRTRISPVFCWPPRAAAALPRGSLCPHHFRSLQQHAIVIVDGPQGRSRQSTVWLRHCVTAEAARDERNIQWKARFLV